MDSLSEPEDTFQMDPFFESDLVYGINAGNFKEFLKSKDLVMVMFYDTANRENYQFKKYFAEAANTTQRPNHAYAAVNCNKNPGLCAVQKAFNTPMLKLYAGESPVGSIRELRDLDHPLLKTYVESADIKTVAHKPSTATA